MNTQPNFHRPVLKNEVIDALNVKADCWFVDCNIGGGGHTREILKKGGKVIGIDLDFEAIEKVKLELMPELNSGRLLLFQSNFSHLQEILAEAKVNEVSGVLFDLGVSSHQLEKAERGFSFNLDAPLDMRMDQSQGASARDLINGLAENELTFLFTKLGEERFARVIARRIVEERKKGLITTTHQLAKIIISARKPSKFEKVHPATRVFQALRIAVNDELNSLREALPPSFSSLEKGGRLVVISFHSLEDRIVKNYFRDLEADGLAKSLFKKPLGPSEEEVENNPRSRSAKLRAVEKF